MSSDLFDTAISEIHKAYSSTNFKLPVGQWTILAAFFLTSEGHELGQRQTKIISLATGTKCLPEARLPACGEALHDSHAEVLARRGAVRWFLEEIARYQESQNAASPSFSGYHSSWIKPTESLDGICLFDVREGVKINLYVSTVPCGDASMRYLASTQDQEMAALKASSTFPDLEPTAASRGRDDYSRLGALRTKPGRADSPRTRCMSCSDKIAAWNVLGFQGALASRFLRPIYLSNIVIGEIPVELQEVVLEDCERALWGRLQGKIEDLSLHQPELSFTNVPFVHSRSVVEQKVPIQGSCVESLCWVADNHVHEVLINGLKRGVAPKHRFREKSRPKLSKSAFFHVYSDLSARFGKPIPNSTTYLEAKRSSKAYQAAKEQLVGPCGPFSGWIKTGEQTENFVLVSESNSSSCAN